VETFLQQVINGLSIGGMYALVAVGFTLIFGVLRVVYLAHGAVLVVGSYMGLFVVTRVSNVPLAVVVAMVACFALGILIELVSIRPVHGADHLIPMVTTVSLATAILEILRLSVNQGNPIQYPDDLLQGRLKFSLFGAQLRVSEGQLVTFGAALVLMFVLGYVVNRTWLGRSIRAVAQAPDTAAILGISVHRVSALTVGLASMLAGAAGVLFGLTLPAVDPYFGEGLQFKALAIVLFAGLGSVPGAIVGGLLLGTVEALGAGYLSSSWRDVFAFLVMILILLLRPAGLFGRKTTVRA
jgi:branched-chain amino acid transport system permease protein